MFGLALRKVGLCNAAGVVDQYIQTTELPFGKGDHPEHIGLGSYVNKDESRPSSFRADFTNGACASVFVHICDDDGRPLTGEAPGDGSPYPGTRASNHGDFIYDLHYALPPSP